MEAVGWKLVVEMKVVRMHRASNKAGQILTLLIFNRAAVGQTAREGVAQRPQCPRLIFPGDYSCEDIIEKGETL
eukprot:1542195-Heterocapsa_arctica.AAC.1